MMMTRILCHGDFVCQSGKSLASSYATYSTSIGCLATLGIVVGLVDFFIVHV